ncbi:MAG: ABC transporter permease [Chitinophagaceae bacterium]|nr:ABC transporter permease [Chitinophagaceae bacterium]MCW5926661.1 ABC transporter permease [Chitinophagaceae bacterium]
MFRNYFKITFRNLRRNRIYSFINIFGLSIGLACSMLILLYIKDEVSFDRFHEQGSNIYRIVQKTEHNGNTNWGTHTGYLQGPRFADNVPGIRSFVRLNSQYHDIKTGTEIRGRELLSVDSSFFNIFSFPLLYGDPNTCLKDPSSIVLTEDEAKKQFGTADALGKVVMLNFDSTFTPLKVTAVTKRVPQNSSIQFDMLIPFREKKEDALNNYNWYNFFLNTFVLVEPNSSIAAIENGMQQFYVRDASQAFKELNERYGGGAAASMGTYLLQRYDDMHLNPQLSAQNGLKNGSNPMYSYILSGIALFILVIACINFVNLTVARSVKRAKEIGIRKVVGGDRRQLIWQFLGESFMLCFIAFALALLLVQLMLPVFNELSNKALAISYLFDWKLAGGYIGLFLLTGLLAGFYPALVLSGFNPVKTLYSRFTLSGKNYLQKGLVIMQFSLASFLIIATVAAYLQFNYLTTKDLGYDDNNVVELFKGDLRQEEVALFKAELLKNPDILEVGAKNSGQWITSAKVASDSTMSFDYETIDESYIPLMKIPIVKGRNFSKDFPADAAKSVLVNESFVEKAGWKEPIGEIVNFFYNDNEIYTVVGVVKDYHNKSLMQKISPQLFTMKPGNTYGLYSIRIRPGSESRTLDYIQKAFMQFYPMSPYHYEFKDQAKLSEYTQEAKWKQILMFGAVLTIFISCIGLFGLSVLSAEKRTKEIGIRKVLGASVNNIATILSRDFLKLVIIALLIAIPAAWIVANKWLGNYPYRVTLNWQMFAAAGLLVIVVALVTVSFQAVRAAMGNPVAALRSE